MKIGIPEGLLYYDYFTLWKAFFQKLGIEVITSGNTNKQILNQGIRHCVDEACLPVKAYHGHVDSLKNKVDVIFLPRLISICKNEYICPKFCGLPEMIKNSINNLPPLLIANINLRKSENSLINSFIKTGKYFSNDKNKIIYAYNYALKKQQEYERNLQKNNNITKTKNIALLGHPYITEDKFINMDIKQKLIKYGFYAITNKAIDENTINNYAKILPKRHFWTFGRKILGSGLYFAQCDNIDGIIYMSSFACGIDSIIEDYLQRYIKRISNKPYMKIVLDEHSGQAGFVTRLEAFLDMVKFKEKNESNISAYGGNICCNQGIT